MKQYLLVIIVCTNTLSATAQFSLDHYHPIALIVNEQIDTCSIFVINSDESLTIEQSYIYDQNGREIENRRDFQNFSFVYHYEQQGKQTAIYFVPFDSEFEERDTLIYNKKNQLIQTITYSKNNTETRRNEFTYKRGLLREEKYILKGKLQVLSIYHYNKQNRVHQIERYFRGKHDIDWFHEYDKSGNLTSFINLSPEGDTTLVHRFKYNNQNLRIEHATYTNGKELVQLYTTKYNDKGLIQYMESRTGIKNNDPDSGTYEKTIYKYTHQK